jgi:DNA replication and repair protein RecF
MYEQILKRRNKLLDQIREGAAQRTALTFYDMSLLKHGQYVQEQRTALVTQLNASSFPWHFAISYDKSLLSTERLQQYAQQEVAVGYTLVGPHKDDFDIGLQLDSRSSQHNYSVSTHGSRGQQRLAVLWLKHYAFTALQKKFAAPPILLLDDIFSELDSTNRKLLLPLLTQTQTIVTTAEEDVPALFSSHAHTVLSLE